jgi:uncharacterized membrane protein YfcA
VIKESLYLIAGAVVLASVGWALWHYAGNDALDILLIVALIASVADNVRLRRSLREKNGP